MTHSSTIRHQLLMVFLTLVLLTRSRGSKGTRQADSTTASSLHRCHTGETHLKQAKVLKKHAYASNNLYLKVKGYVAMIKRRWYTCFGDVFAKDDFKPPGNLI